MRPAIYLVILRRPGLVVSLVLSVLPFLFGVTHTRESGAVPLELHTGPMLAWRHHARNCSEDCRASVCRYGKHGSFAFRGSGARVLLWVSCLVTRRITTRVSR